MLWIWRVSSDRGLQRRHRGIITGGDTDLPLSRSPYTPYWRAPSSRRQCNRPIWTTRMPSHPFRFWKRRINVINFNNALSGTEPDCFKLTRWLWRGKLLFVSFQDCAKGLKLLVGVLVSPCFWFCGEEQAQCGHETLEGLAASHDEAADPDVFHSRGWVYLQREYPLALLVSLARPEIQWW